MCYSNSGLRLAYLPVLRILLGIISLLHCILTYSSDRVEINIGGKYSGVSLVKTANSFRLASIEKFQEIFDSYRIDGPDNELFTLLESACNFQMNTTSSDQYDLFLLAIPKSFEVFWRVHDVLHYARDYSGDSNIESAVDIGDLSIPSGGCTSQSSSDAYRHNFAIVYNGQFEYTLSYLCLTGLIFHSSPQNEVGKYVPYGHIKYFFNLTGNDLTPVKIDITRVLPHPFVAFYPTPPAKQLFQGISVKRVAASVVAGSCVAGGAILGFHLTGGAAGWCLGALFGFVAGTWIDEEVAELVDTNYKQMEENRKAVISVNNRVLEKSQQFAFSRGLITESHGYKASIPNPQVTNEDSVENVQDIVPAVMPNMSHGIVRSRK